MNNFSKMVAGVAVLASISMSLEAAIKVPWLNTSGLLIEPAHINSRQQAAKATPNLSTITSRHDDLTLAHFLIEEPIQPKQLNSNDLTFATDIAFIKQGYDTAEKVQLMTLGVAQSATELNDLQKAVALDQLGAFYVVQSRYEEAESRLHASLKLREKALGSSHILVAVSLNNLASLAVRQKYPAVAERLLKRSLDIVRHVSGPQHANSATMLINLGDVYQSEARLDEAEALYEEAMSIWVDSPGDPRRRAIGQNSLGRLLLSQRRFDDARIQFEQTLSLLKQNYMLDHPYVQQAIKNLDALNTAHETNSKGEHISSKLVAEFSSQLPQNKVLTATTGSPSGLRLKLF